jgi:hypothetical protein
MVVIEVIAAAPADPVYPIFDDPVYPMLPVDPI